MSGPVLRACLAPHPSTPCAAVRSIEVRVTRDAGRIELAFLIDADLDRVRLPHRAPPRRADGLWRHTCFEAFVMPDPGPAYIELNFSPSGEWACYGFERYRRGRVRHEPIGAPSITVFSDDRASMTASSGAASETSCRESAGAEVPWWSLQASVELGDLADGATARAALAVVIEQADGQLCYWALAHPSCRPNFHHADAYALKI